MGKLSKRAAQRGANSKVVEFVDVAAAGDVRAVKKLIKSGKVEIDDGEMERLSMLNSNRTSEKPCHFLEAPKSFDLSPINYYFYLTKSLFL